MGLKGIYCVGVGQWTMISGHKAIDLLGANKNRLVLRQLIVNMYSMTCECFVFGADVCSKVMLPIAILVRIQEAFRQNPDARAQGTRVRWLRRGFLTISEYNVLDHSWARISPFFWTVRRREICQHFANNWMVTFKVKRGTS